MEIHYLTWIGQRIGKESEQVAAPRHIRTVGDLQAWLLEKGDGYQCLKNYQDIINVAVNGTLVDKNAPCALGKNDKVVFFSPLAGG